jgi:hypothetical protein
MSRAISPSWVADRHCTDVDVGGRWLGGDVEEPGHAEDRCGIEAEKPRHAGDRGGIGCGVEDGRGIEVVARRLDRTGAGVTGWPGNGGARGGVSSREGSGVEELATPGCSWSRAWRTARA